jgi:dTDP-4-amino-4,6-dideoxygalactose transaminase
MTPPLRVPLLDLRRIDPTLEQGLEDAFRRVLRSGHYILGPEVDAFEQECAAYVGCKHAISMSSGTDALLAALMALGVGRDDEVICPTFTFFATGGVIARLGARPVFVDSELGSFNLDPTRLEAAITKRTKALVPVHLFGQCAEMGPILDVAARHGVPVIEDAAQALGADVGGRAAGTLGQVGCFSFFPSKNLGALGDAGLTTTSDPDLAERLRVLRVHGGKPKYHHAVVGGNFRMDALQAALLRAKLPYLDAASAKRGKNAEYYSSTLAAAKIGSHSNDARVVLPLVQSGRRHVFNQFVIRIPGKGERDRVRRHLAERGVGTEIYYPTPLHLQPCFRDLGHRAGDFPIAERLAAETLALPVFPELTAEELRYVTDSLADAFSATSKGLSA